VFSAGFILFCSGLAKLISATGSDGFLETKDPIIGMQFRYLFLAAGIVEFLTALLSFFGKCLDVKAMCIGCLATSFLIYRISLILIGYHKPCHCLGNLTTAIHVAPNLADLIMKCILVYLLFGSYISLYCLWRQRNAMPSVSVAAPSQNAIAK
jgi:hypothetical protein